MIGTRVMPGRRASYALQLFGAGLALTIKPTLATLFSLFGNHRATLPSYPNNKPCRLLQVLPYSLKVVGSQSRHLLLRSMQVS